MHLDLRYPIGLLLVVYGVILAADGALVGTSVLGLNVDLYWGAVMIACGAAALFLARRAGRSGSTVAGESRSGRHLS